MRSAWVSTVWVGNDRPNNAVTFCRPIAISILVDACALLPDPSITEWTDPHKREFVTIFEVYKIGSTLEPWQDLAARYGSAFSRSPGYKSPIPTDEARD